MGNLNAEVQEAEATLRESCRGIQRVFVDAPASENGVAQTILIIERADDFELWPKILGSLKIEEDVVSASWGENWTMIAPRSHIVEYTHALVEELQRSREMPQAACGL